MIDHVFDLMGFKDDEETSNKYKPENRTRNTCLKLIKNAAIDEKYTVAAAELVCHWADLSSNFKKVESQHSWVYYQQLLDAQLTGYKTWNEEQRREKRRTTSKTQTV